MAVTRRIGRLLIGATLVIIFVAANVAQAQSGARLAGQEIRIGAIVPSSGPLAEWGKSNTITLQILREK